MVFSYCKSIAKDFNENININQLQQEIINSISNNTLLYIDTEGDSIYINFESELSIDDNIIFEIIISNYVMESPYPNANLFFDPKTLNMLYSPTNSNDPIYNLSSRFIKLKSRNKTEIYISNIPENQSDYSSLSLAVKGCQNSNTIFILYPGTYVEDNPIILQPGCSVISHGTFGNTILCAKNPDQDMFILNDWCYLRGISIMGTSENNARAIYYDGTVKNNMPAMVLISECAILNCCIGMEIENGENLALVTMLNINSYIPMFIGLYAHSGAKVVTSWLSVNGVKGLNNISYGIWCTDPDTKITCVTTGIYYCSYGIYINNNGTIHMSQLLTDGHKNSIVIGPIGTESYLNGNSLYINNSINSSLDILAKNCTINIESGNLQNVSINNPNNVKFHMDVNIAAYHNYQLLYGDVWYGSTTEQSTLAVGQGKYNFDGIVYLTNSNLDNGKWNRLTHNIDGEIEIDLFQSSTPGNCFYIGFYTPPTALKFHITKSSFAIKKNDIIFEYLTTNSFWKSINIMQLESKPPMTFCNSSIFNYTGKYFVRLGLLPSNVFINSVLNSVPRQWIRIRIINTLSSIPKVSYVKLCTNNSQIRSDGFIHHFGKGSLVQYINFDLINLITNNEENTINQNFHVLKNIFTKNNNNSLKSNILSTLCVEHIVPPNIDIAYPLKIKIIYVVDNISAGNIQITLTYLFTSYNSNIYLNESDIPNDTNATNSIVKNLTIAANNNNRELHDEIIININNMDLTNECIIWLKLERDAGVNNISDTYPGNFNIIKFIGKYVAWCSGNHLLSF